MSIKVDEKILEEFKNSSRHNFNIKVDEVIRQPFLVVADLLQIVPMTPRLPSESKYH